MNINEFNVLVQSGEVNLAAAYGLLLNCGNSVLLRSFRDMVNITNRIRIVEKLIEQEPQSYWKDKINKRVEWHKSNITSNLSSFKGAYASFITVERANIDNKEEVYKKLIETIESKDTYDDFYAWFDAINSVI